MQEKYDPHNIIVERIAHSLITEQDITQFGALIVDIYEAGYNKGIKDFQDGLRKKGYTFETDINRRS